MISTIKINTDGTIDCYDLEGCKVPHMCGDWSLLHNIYKNYTAAYPSKEVPDECRCENADIYIQNGLSGQSIQIRITHLSKMLKFIKYPEY